MEIMIQENIPLAKYTSFRIGGLARFFTEVGSEEELLDALKFAENKKLKFFLLGGGSNILISDEGFDGLVIKLKPNSKNEYWAGNCLASLLSFCKENSFMGMEWAAGIPGTIAGAVRGNAGAYGGCMADNIEKVKTFNLKNKTIRDYSCEECQFAYRTSIFKKNTQLIILAVSLKLEKGDKLEIEKKIQKIIEKRRENIPKNFSAGSFFQNPIVKNSALILQFEKETGVKCLEQKIPAGWLIDRVGLRGKKIGGVAVSEKHANFIINTGQGTAQNVIILASIIKQKVRHNFSIQLKEEVGYVGF